MRETSFYTPSLAKLNDEAISQGKRKLTNKTARTSSKLYWVLYAIACIMCAIAVTIF